MSPDAWIAVIVGTCTLLGIIAGWVRWLRPRYRKARRTASAITETLVGRDAIIDPATGRELVPSQPGLGVRMAAMEEAIVRLSHMDSRVTTVEQATADNQRRITALEEARIERIVTQAESAQAWRAVADRDVEDD